MINTRVEEKFNSLKVRNIFYFNKITVDTTDVEKIFLKYTSAN